MIPVHVERPPTFPARLKVPVNGQEVLRGVALGSVAGFSLNSTGRIVFPPIGCCNQGKHDSLNFASDLQAYPTRIGPPLRQQPYEKFPLRETTSGLSHFAQNG